MSVRVLREIRICLLEGCEKSFEVRVTNTKKYYCTKCAHVGITHPLENRLCKCGCGEFFECKPNSVRKFVNREHCTRWFKDNPVDHSNQPPPWNTGLTKETDVRVKNNGRNISKSLIGNPKLGGFKKGKDNYMFGKSGPLSPTWKGGTVNLPYPATFTVKLKKLIRERDGNICQLCGKMKENNGNTLTVHHIDYVKDNCDPLNLITLCNRCNTKVNFGRPAWTEFFQKKLKFA